MTTSVQSVLAAVVSITRTVAGVLSNPVVAAVLPTGAIPGYLLLAAALAERGEAAQGDLVALDAQIKAAVAQGRGLSVDELAQWKQRDDVATASIATWLAAQANAKAAPAK